MNNQTDALFNVVLPNVPALIQPLINAYTPSPQNAINTTIDFNLYPEPYYGDFNKCSVVLLTHNPGNSTEQWKGLNSVFETRIGNNNKAVNYYNMAAQPNFPNTATDTFYTGISNQVHNHFSGIQNFTENPFIRDLVPYHSREFGNLNMAACASYLYTYFFNQVFAASFNSEIYARINAKRNKPATIIYARGKAWKDNNFGLRTVGWELIGKVYSYCYIFKANFQKIKTIIGFNLDSYPQNILEHDAYIIVMTQARQGAKYGVYLNNRAPLLPVNLMSVIHQYDNGAANIDHNEEMDKFFETIR